MHALVNSECNCLCYAQIGAAEGGDIVRNQLYQDCCLRQKFSKIVDSNLNISTLTALTKTVLFRI